MTRSSERTLVERLISDVDDSLHDDVCLYLSAHETFLQEVVGSVNWEHSNATVSRLQLERVIDRANGGVVGFLDVCGFVSVEPPEGWWYVVEVKTAPVPIGALLRQLRLYQYYARFYSQGIWVVATTWMPSPKYLTALLQQGFNHVYIPAERVR